MNVFFWPKHHAPVMHRPPDTAVKLLERTGDPETGVLIFGANEIHSLEFESYW